MTQISRSKMYILRHKLRFKQVIFETYFSYIKSNIYTEIKYSHCYQIFTLF